MKSSRQYHFLPFVVFGYCLLFVPGCEKEPASPVIARVGKAVLTLDDLYQSIPPEYVDQISYNENIDYVKQWIDTELLYQAALRQKIDKEPIIKNRLKQMEKDLLSAEMISRTSFSNQGRALNESKIQEYYNQHKEDLVRERDVVRYLEIVVDDLETAERIRREATEDNFATLAAQHSKIPVTDPEKLPYIHIDEMPPSLRDIVEKTSVPGMAGPIQTEVGYHIIKVVERFEKGNICKLDEIREDIMSVLSTKQQKTEMTKLLSELRLKTNVELNLGLIPGAQGLDSPDTVFNGT